ncbi:MAG: SPFH domain-containing protein, partial [Vampirovibrionia bacterium]
MLGIRFIKAQPTTFIIEYRNGSIKKQGAGLSFFYYAPVTSIVAVPIGTSDVPFMIKETTLDHQPVTVQGQIVYKISEPKLIAEMLNYTLADNGIDYVSDDHSKLNDRIVIQVQVLVKNSLMKMSLDES